MKFSTTITLEDIFLQFITVFTDNDNNTIINNDNNFIQESSYDTTDWRLYKILENEMLKT